MCKVNTEMPAPEVMPRPPVEKPEFTIGTLRKAIPAHCWERSVVRSFGYLFLDLIMAAGGFCWWQALAATQ